MKDYLEYYYTKYPKSTVQDYVKLVYQIVFGVSHIIDSPGACLKKLKEEISTLEDNIIQDLYEYVGDEYVRANLRTYCKYNLNINLLNEYFIESANVFSTDTLRIDEVLNILSEFLVSKGFNKNDVKNYIEEYKKQDYPILQHSEIYKESYKPAYRLIHRKYITEEMRFYQIINYLDTLPKKEVSKIALEGKCCSGKSTIANLIEKEYSATIIPVDDFFDVNNNPEIGINSERLDDEVLGQLTLNKPLTYKRWDCKNKTFQTVTIEKVNPIVIVEGVFSYNNKLKNKYHGLIYLDIDEKEQMERLTNRSKHLLHRFINEWIPRENQYYKKNNIKYKANIIV